MIPVSLAVHFPERMSHSLMIPSCDPVATVLHSQSPHLMGKTRPKQCFDGLYDDEGIIPLVGGQVKVMEAFTVEDDVGFLHGQYALLGGDVPELHSAVVAARYRALRPILLIKSYPTFHQFHNHITISSRHHGQ